MRGRTVAEINLFSLYGEPLRPIDDRFVHVEPLHRRTRPAGGRILPHAHESLSQVFVLSRGGGDMFADDASLPFAAPCVLLLPSRSVHGFSFRADATGTVLTVAEALAAEMARRAPELGQVFDRPRACGIDGGRTARDLELLLKRLAPELAWPGPAHDAVVEGLLALVLALVLRGIGGASDGSADDRDTKLAARFRRMVEEHFRERPPIGTYLSALHVTEARLRRCCARVLHQTPNGVVRERTLLEAKRLLLHTQNSCGEVAWRLGFEDPAYFSRFFRAAAGCTATEFRRRRAR